MPYPRQARSKRLEWWAPSECMHLPPSPAEEVERCEVSARGWFPRCSLLTRRRPRQRAFDSHPSERKRCHDARCSSRGCAGWLLGHSEEAAQRASHPNRALLGPGGWFLMCVRKFRGGRVSVRWRGSSIRVINYAAGRADDGVIVGGERKIGRKPAGVGGYSRRRRL